MKLDEDTRALVTVAEIAAITPIEGADAIEAATIRGWTVVVKKGEFAPGDRCVYVEIDAFLPVSDPRFEFLAARGTKTVVDPATDVSLVGHVVRTAKLRGTYSQGVAFPLSAFPEFADVAADAFADGRDLSELVGVTKYEPPIPPELAGVVVGAFPTHIVPKTDAERVQNLVDVFGDLVGFDWVATEKVDGTSVTYIRDGDRLRVCSRNLELVPDGTTQLRLADDIGLLDVLDDGDVVQAELYGEGVQSNPLRIRGQALAVFGVWRDRAPLPRASWPSVLQKCAAPELDLVFPSSVADAIAQVDGIRSMVSPGRLAEGVVWHTADGSRPQALDGRSCFKVISNRWLLKHDS